MGTKQRDCALIVSGKPLFMFHNPGMEKRFNSQRVIVERHEDRDPRIVGYAAVFHREGDAGTEYELWPGLVERFSPKAFDRVIRERQDVRALVDHASHAVLGRTGPGTLRLSIDDVGLRMEIDPPDTQVGRDIVTSIDRGDITGASIGFMVREVRYLESPDESPDYRYIEDVDLLDVSPVTYPAYEGTAVGLRSLVPHEDNLRAEWQRWKQVRSRLASIG